MVCADISRGLFSRGARGNNKPFWMEGNALCSRGFRLELFRALVSIASSEKSGVGTCLGEHVGRSHGDGERVDRSHGEIKGVFPIN